MVKEKLNSTRIYDENGYRLRAACICVKDETEQEILLISTKRNSDRWIVPGGGMEPLEDASIAAAREAYEEAGVKGMVSRCLGVFENSHSKTKTSVYLLVVDQLCDEWDEKSLGRKRQWFSVPDARLQLGMYRPEHGVYLEMLDSHGSKQNIPTSPDVTHVSVKRFCLPPIAVPVVSGGVSPQKNGIGANPVKV
ncbi:hypothetical protein HELRODRAFT_74988 [Helobdella robusta]|uniref:diphosphoinositol-polyphosphate diphosphatase n=1 Tax=Helobdella robusta TaxID=6412 RepID=T1G1Z2_HELRO|nr:hypothetical protein HELRODRAFT_74789 [Helobdella robusta]XP_009013486.1 hypothetical protein HELRODRAFT_74988 [Helobdella robusta]ESO08555.1 hypothetical protein HELRODRAFT_74789 [Helobdella robusta]ESO08556.1 hypothetical protein HELRODRAFT_74988 [Helobdella robusta]